VWHILSDGEFSLVLANAKRVKNVPGRKTDVNEATWLADLMAHGLIRGSFVPDAQTQELRGLLRTRKQFTRDRSSHVQRLQKTLEDANIKLDSVISDILGPSGHAMIEAMIARESNPDALTALAHPRIKAPPAVLREALRGRAASGAIRTHSRVCAGGRGDVTRDLFLSSSHTEIAPVRAERQLSVEIRGRGAGRPITSRALTETSRRRTIPSG
jgi:Transposase